MDVAVPVKQHKPVTASTVYHVVLLEVTKIILYQLILFDFTDSWISILYYMTVT